MAKSKPKLKPCPWCGTKIVEISGSIGSNYWGRCWNCNSTGPIAARKSTAVRFWNTRRKVVKRDKRT